MPYIKTERTNLKGYYLQKISIYIYNFENKYITVLHAIYQNNFTVTLCNFVGTGADHIYNACQSSKFAIKKKASDKNTNQ